MTYARRVPLLGVILVLLLSAVAAQAQQNGQFWVRFFEDSDGSGAREAGEGLITRGAAVSLADGSGAIIATALLDDSPNGSQGLVGFLNLPPGTYTAVITSADFAATAETVFTRELTNDGLPVVVEFAAQPIVDVMPEPPDVRGLFGLPIYLGERTQVARVALGILGACIVAAFMTVLGGAAYWLMVRRNRRSRPDYSSGGTSGHLPAVPG